MAFSKIKEVELFNFMSFEHTRLVFDDSNILNIKGYNDSGKSAILRAIMVCLADMFKRAQVKYIRYGCEYFRIVVTFTDGVSVLRDKYLNGQSLYEMYKDGEVIYTTKQGSRLTRIEGVPETIQKYLGLCMTETGCLNYQTCSEKMMLVETSGSENYQELNTVLKSDEISRATELINSDRNKLNSTVIEVQKEFESKSAVLQSRSYVDKKIISFLEKKDKETEELVEKGKVIQDAHTNLEKLSRIESIPEMSKIDITPLVYLTGVLNLLREYDKLPEMPEVPTIDVEKARVLEKLLTSLKGIEDYKDIPKVEYIDTSSIILLEDVLHTLKNLPKEEIPEVSKVDMINFDRLKVLKSLRGLLGDLEEVLVDKKELDSLYEEWLVEHNKLLNEAKDEGVLFEKCPNCGTLVEYHIQERVS